MTPSLRRFPWALALSVLLHGGAAAAVAFPLAAARAEPPPPTDVWAGMAVDLVELTENDERSSPPGPLPGNTGEGEGKAPAPEAPDPAPPGPAAKEPPPPPPRLPREPASKEPPAASQEKLPASQEKPPTASKEPSQEAPRPRRRKPKKPASPSPSPSPVFPQRGPGGEDRPPAPPASPGGTPGPSAVRDLGLAFTRAVAPAGQPDKAWGAVAAGPAGSLEVALEIDAEGKIKGFSPISKSPPEHLVGLVKRVLAVLRSGYFAVRGPDPSAGTQVLRLTATASDVPKETLDGIPVMLSFSYDRGKGSSSFIQQSGRKVEVTVELLRVEAAR